MAEFINSKSTIHGSYDPAYFARLFAIEDRHFWFRARSRAISALVQQDLRGLAPGYRVLEVGCGTGHVLGVLERACPGGTVTGMDLFAEGLSYARQRTSGPLVQGDANRPPFGEQFELIGLFDVLEHVPDDLHVLQHLQGMLVGGGTLLLTVPAHPSLWSYADEAAHHCRRYKVAELEHKLKHTGFRVEYLTQYMASTYPLVWLGRRIMGWVGPHLVKDKNGNLDLFSNEIRIVPVLNGLLALLLAQEVRLIAGRRQLPIGTSLLALACKAD